MKVGAPFLIKKRVHRNWFGFVRCVTFEVIGGVQLSDESVKHLIDRHGSERFGLLHELNGFQAILRYFEGRLKWI